MRARIVIKQGERNQSRSVMCIRESTLNGGKCPQKPSYCRSQKTFSMTGHLRSLQAKPLEHLTCCSFVTDSHHRKSWEIRQAKHWYGVDVSDTSRKTLNHSLILHVHNIYKQMYSLGKTAESCKSIQ